MLYVWETPIMVEVEQIVADLKDTLITAGVPLLRDVKDVGTNIMVTCSEHKGGQERNPSMGISKDDKVLPNGKTVPAGTVHCFTCGYTSDLPTWISKLLGLATPADGFKWLIERYHYAMEGERPEIPISLGRPEAVTAVTDDSLTELAKVFTGYFSGSEAERYMTETRKIPKAVCMQFRLGYDEARGSVTMPVFNNAGEVLMIKERQLVGKSYANSGHSVKSAAAFGLLQAQTCIAELKAEGKRIPPIWVTEGEIDCMTLWADGKIAVAIMGNAVSHDQARLLLSLNDVFVAALDNDEAGKKGNARLKKMMIPLGARIYNLRYTCDKKDFNDMTVDERASLELF